MMNEYITGHAAMDNKPKLNYYFRLESESSINSEEDSESVNSIQDRDTELAHDSTDTEDGGGSYFEYEVASLSEETGDVTDSDTSTGTEIEDFYVAEEVIAAVLGDTSLEAWAPDGEDSYSSTTDSEDVGKTDFWTCAQCKSKNNNPRYRLCEKCFQVRKNFYPPRPRRCKKRKIDSKKDAVNVDNLRSCLNGLTQDSGVGSSQEFTTLDFKEIKVPEQHLNRCSTPTVSEISASESNLGSSGSSKDTNDTGFAETTNRKRKLSDSLSENEVRPPKRIIIEAPLSTKVSELEKQEEINTELKELCIICNIKIKDGIFLHGNSAHSCCCYKCSLKTWKTTKRCPVCNRRVNNVVKLYSI